MITFSNPIKMQFWLPFFFLFQTIWSQSIVINSISKLQTLSGYFEQTATSYSLTFENFTKTSDIPENVAGTLILTDTNGISISGDVTVYYLPSSDSKEYPPYTSGILTNPENYLYLTGSSLTSTLTNEIFAIDYGQLIFNGPFRDKNTQYQLHDIEIRTRIVSDPNKNTYSFTVPSVSKSTIIDPLFFPVKGEYAFNILVQPFEIHGTFSYETQYTFTLSGTINLAYELNGIFVAQASGRSDSFDVTGNYNVVTNVLLFTGYSNYIHSQFDGIFYFDRWNFHILTSSTSYLIITDNQIIPQQTTSVYIDDTSTTVFPSVPNQSPLSYINYDGGTGEFSIYMGTPNNEFPFMIRGVYLNGVVSFSNGQFLNGCVETNGALFGNIGNNFFTSQNVIQFECHGTSIQPLASYPVGIPLTYSQDVSGSVSFVPQDGALVTGILTILNTPDDIILPIVPFATYSITLPTPEPTPEPPTSEPTPEPPTSEPTSEPTTHFSCQTFICPLYWLSKDKSLLVQQPDIKQVIVMNGTFVKNGTTESSDVTLRGIFQNETFIKGNITKMNNGGSTLLPFNGTFWNNQIVFRGGISDVSFNGTLWLRHHINLYGLFLSVPRNISNPSFLYKVNGTYEMKYETIQSQCSYVNQSIWSNDTIYLRNECCIQSCIFFRCVYPFERVLNADRYPGPYCCFPSKKHP